MKTQFFFLFSIYIWSFNPIYAQENAMSDLPYQEIPAYPESHASGNVMARFIDGLGYRFYWATEDLTETDLAYKPSEGARSCMETIAHIYDMSVTILNTSQGKVNKRSEVRPYSTYEELRSQTLLNLYAAREFFANQTAEQLTALKITNESAKGTSTYPLWNLMNGQISDCIYHTGQLVTFRRTTGNPVNPKMNVFMGKNRK